MYVLKLLYKITNLTFFWQSTIDIHIPTHPLIEIVQI